MKDNYQDVVPELREYLRKNWDYDYEEVYVLYPKKTGRNFLLTQVLSMLEYFEKMRYVTVITKEEEVYFPRIITQLEQEKFINYMVEHRGEIKDVSGICWDLNRFRVNTRHLVLMAVDYYNHEASTWIEQQLNLDVPVSISFEYGTFYGSMVLKYNEFLFKKLKKLSVEPGRETDHFVRVGKPSSQREVLKLVWSYWQHSPIKREDSFYRRVFDLVSQGNMDVVELLSAYCQGVKSFEQYAPNTPEGGILKSCLSFGDENLD